MKIIKQDGSLQNFNPNKILSRIKRSTKNLNVNADVLSQKVIPQVMDNMTVQDIDNIIIIESLNSSFKHPDYSNLAASIEIDQMHKDIDERKSRYPKLKLNYENDYNFDYMALSTFKKSYRNDDELPQEMYARIATSLETKSDSKRQELYDMLSSKQINFATPINLSSGNGLNNFISCDISILESDSLDGILNSLKEMAESSKNGAGIGIYIGNLRSSHGVVGPYKGKAAGVVRFADIAQGIARFFNQKGKRPGAFALYLPTWHKDIIAHNELRLNEGDEKLRMRDIFTGVVVDDVFMECLIEERDYYIFCPKDLEDNGIKALYECSNDEFRANYKKAVDMGLGEAIKPRTIWNKILASQASTGTPYIIYSGNISKTNMLSHFGEIKSSNLCSETLLYADEHETGQCALGSIPLHTCTDIRKAARTLSYYINIVIDTNAYPTEKARLGGLNQRTIGIGVAGLAEYLYSRGMNFETAEGKEEFRKIMREMYLGAVQGSQDYYEETGKTFKDYENSEYAKGIFNPQKWGVHEEEIDMTKKVSNSLFTALMPTASSSNLLGCTESFEVPQGMIYKRKLDKGEFLVIQRNLVADLEKLGMWDDDLARKIVAHGGSIQDIIEIPENIRTQYKNAYEVSQRLRIEMINHGFPYIDQSTSLNLYYTSGDFTKMSSALIHGWKLGNKTGSYYTRVKKKEATDTRDLFDRANVVIETTDKPDDSDFECFGCSA
jgi:ribonucleoside-diphosphate reductase alpha subunit